MTFLTSPFETTVASAVYLITSACLYIQVSRYGPSNLVSRLMYFHNLIQISIAIFLLISITISQFPQSIFSERSIMNDALQNIQGSDALLPRLAYHYSKFYEYLDIFLVILQGKSNM